MSFFFSTFAAILGNMRKRIVILGCLVAMAMSAMAQKNGDEYADLFNEHLNKGLKSGITMSVELPLYAYGEQMFTLQDTTNEGGVAGFVYNGYTIVDSAQVDSAFMWLYKGIQAFPDRLDLYFGLAATYLYIDQPDMMIYIVEKAMQQEKKNKGQWLWTADEKVDKDEDILFSRIQEDFSRFLEAEDLDNAEKLARMAMTYFPKRAEYVNDLGTVYIYRNNLEEGLKYYKKALKLAPDDELIKGNIEYLEKVKREK